VHLINPTALPRLVPHRAPVAGVPGQHSSGWYIMKPIADKLLAAPPGIIQ